MHVRQAGEAVAIGPSPAAESYLKVDAILVGREATGAEAIHPGYEFLSENRISRTRVKTAGVAFIGRKAKHMRAFGLKHKAGSSPLRRACRLRRAQVLSVTWSMRR